LYFPEEFLGLFVNNNNNNNNNNNTWRKKKKKKKKKPEKHDMKELQKTAILGTGHCTNIKENIERGN
jgi:hypothetical protein